MTRKKKYTCNNSILAEQPFLEILYNKAEEIRGSTDNTSSLIDTPSNVKVSNEFVNCLKNTIEGYLISVLKDAKIIAQKENRETVLARDLILAKSLRKDKLTRNISFCNEQN